MSKKYSLSRFALSFMVAGVCVSCFSVGRFGYIEPFPKNAPVMPVESENMVGEHCQMVMISILDEAYGSLAGQTGRRTWENVNITYQPKMMSNCIQTRALVEGAGR